MKEATEAIENGLKERAEEMEKYESAANVVALYENGGEDILRAWGAANNLQFNNIEDIVASANDVCTKSAERISEIDKTIGENEETIKNNGGRPPAKTPNDTKTTSKALDAANSAAKRAMAEGTVNGEDVVHQIYNNPGYVHGGALVSNPALNAAAEDFLEKFPYDIKCLTFAGNLYFKQTRF